MNRRNFLQLAALAVAGQAAERVFPFRVYSIPSTICAPKLDLVYGSFDVDFTYRELNKAYAKLQRDIGNYPIAHLPSVDWYSTIALPTCRP